MTLKDLKAGDIFSFTQPDEEIITSCGHGYLKTNGLLYMKGGPCEGTRPLIIDLQSGQGRIFKSETYYKSVKLEGYNKEYFDYAFKHFGNSPHPGIPLAEWQLDNKPAELKMSPTPWIIAVTHILGSSDTGGMVCRRPIEPGCTAAQWEVDMRKIVCAVNNTYGVGVDPEAVKEMFDILKQVSMYFNNGSDLSRQVSEIIKKAKL